MTEDIDPLATALVLVSCKARDTARAMSQENVETARRVAAAWNSDDLDGFLAELDPEIEWHAALEQALEGGGSTYRGHEGVRRAWDVYRSEAFGGLTVHIEEFRDLGESVLCLGRMDATGRTTGIEVGGELGLLFTFRNGKLVSSHDFLSHAEALEAAGLSEWPMSQQNVEVVRRSLEAMADRDVEELLSLYAPDVEFLPLTGTHVGSGGYRGHGGVRDYFAEVEDVWDVVRPEPEAMQAIGDDVVVFGHCAIRGKASKLETREALAWVITVRDGKIVRHRVFRTSQEALEAAGLRE